MITGGDSGIGKAAAIAFAREGANVAINDLAEEQSNADEVIKLVEAEGRKVIGIPGELKSEELCKNLVETTNCELGGLDLVANVAGRQKAVESIAELTT